MMISLCFTVFKFTFFCATSANSTQFFKNVLRENETLPAQQEMPMVKSGNLADSRLDQCYILPICISYEA